jgi:hypothetical protein
MPDKGLALEAHVVAQGCQLCHDCVERLGEVRLCPGIGDGAGIVSGSDMDADAPVLESDTKLIWHWQ